MVEDRLKKLDEWVIRWVPRKENVEADSLARIATTLPIKKIVMLPNYLKAMSSITLELVWNTSEPSSNWMHDIVKYL